MYTCLRAAGSDYPRFCHLPWERLLVGRLSACHEQIEQIATWYEIRDLGDHGHGLPSWGLLGFRRRSLLIFPAREQDFLLRRQRLDVRTAARILELATTPIKRARVLQWGEIPLGSSAELDWSGTPEALERR